MQHVCVVTVAAAGDVAILVSVLDISIARTGFVSRIIYSSSGRAPRARAQPILILLAAAGSQTHFNECSIGFVTRFLLAEAARSSIFGRAELQLGG